LPPNKYWVCYSVTCPFYQPLKNLSNSKFEDEEKGERKKTSATILITIYNLQGDLQVPNKNIKILNLQNPV
jgi:hypothetical protein